MALTSEQVDYYLRNKHWANQIILNKARQSGDIIHGAQAVNAQVPVHLQKCTSDYDIYTNNPKKTATEVAKELNKAFNGKKKMFYVKQAKHEGTWKIKSKIAGETIADYTKHPNGIPHKNLLGVKYATIGHSKKEVKRMLGEPESEFRRKKDKSTLARIQAFETKWKWGSKW